ncbi:MAG: 3-oxoacyl-[acyl-carrier-protein] reductase [Spirochaetaceae bacterium]|nr:MAG: 3-oxoacyl-[acyl-carrier-protein] reductase [Spirochaetaceae bacterium]
MLLNGQKALITGGSRGIGREIALQFLKNGASVYYIDLAPGDSLEEYQRIAAENGGTAVYKEGNVADEQTITAVVEEILEQSGGIDVLVNNAGITRDGLVFRMTAQDWNDVLTINLTSAFYISKAISRSMIKRRSGSIINVASIVGVIGNAGQTNYSASKAGLIGFTKSLAREVAGRNVRVNAVAPGFINTKMTEKLNDEQRDVLRAQIPMNRIGDPEEVAKVILFLASDLASYVTGQVIHITGGMGM